MLDTPSATAADESSVHPSTLSNLPESDLVEAIRGAREAVARWMALCQALQQS